MLREIVGDVRFVLASASPRRRELLAQIGMNPEVMVSTVEEIITTDIPEEAVKELSGQKARNVAERCEPGTLVIGADTVVAAQDRILGKPNDHEAAVGMIRSIAGGQHEVYTGVTLILCEDDGFKERSFVEKTVVHVYPMSEIEIRDYAYGEEPMDKAGAYGIQGIFASFIRGIDGDYSNVVGLPLGRTYQEIKELCK